MIDLDEVEHTLDINRVLIRHYWQEMSLFQLLLSLIRHAELHVIRLRARNQ